MAFNNTSTHLHKVIFNKIRGVEFMCRNITLPSLSVDPINYSTPYHTNSIPGNRLTFDPVTLIYAVDENYDNYLSLFNWMRGFANPNGPLEGEKEEPSTMSVSVLTNNENPFRNFILDGVFPINVESPNFDISNTSYEPIELSATFQINDIIFE